MQSVMTHSYQQLPEVNISRSKFNRSSGYKTTMNSGYLVPFFCDEVIPGDTFDLKTSVLARMATPIHPIMDNLHFDTFYFFVPSRLLWEHFKNFNGERKRPNDTNDYILPTISAPVGGFKSGSIADYFGLPLGVAGLKVNALPFRAYNLIYNEWFRDENLIDPVAENYGDGPDNPGDYNLLRRGKRHDYFTSCLPWPQKSDEVEISLGKKAPVAFDLETNMRGKTLKDFNYPSGTVYTKNAGLEGTSYTSEFWVAGLEHRFENNHTALYTDLSQATAVTINSLREAMQLQRMFERDARGGTRYTEIIRSHFGVVSPDSRLQRPEYLGGSSDPVIITPVAQNSGTIETSPQGNLAGYGFIASHRNGFTQSFTEHGYIIGICQIWADLTYQQGINRMWSRKTRYDFYWPSFAYLGEQAVLNKEIFADGSVNDEKVFGYQERYAEYRYKPSLITGKMRSSDPQSLDVWHLSQDFKKCPTLSKDFIEDNPPVSRVIAVPSEPEFILDCYFDLKCTRPLPVFGTPGMFDHF